MINLREVEFGLRENLKLKNQTTTMGIEEQTPTQIQVWEKNHRKVRRWIERGRKK